MGLNVLLEILRALEGFAAEVAFVRLEWHVNTNVRSDVVALDGGGTASAPCASQIEVVSALAPDVTFTHMVLEILSASQSCADCVVTRTYVKRLCAVASLAASLPLASEVVNCRAWGSGNCLLELGWRRLADLLGLLLLLLLRRGLHGLCDGLRCRAVHVGEVGDARRQSLAKAVLGNIKPASRWRDKVESYSRRTRVSKQRSRACKRYEVERACE